GETATPAAGCFAEADPSGMATRGTPSRCSPTPIHGEVTGRPDSSPRWTPRPQEAKRVATDWLRGMAVVPAVGLTPAVGLVLAVAVAPAVAAGLTPAGLTPAGLVPAGPAVGDPLPAHRRQ